MLPANRMDDDGLGRHYSGIVFIEVVDDLERLLVDDSSWNLGAVGSNHSNELACHRPDRRNRIMDAGSKGSEISID